MTDAKSPPQKSPHDQSRDAAQAPDAAPSDDLREGVQKQREHVQDVTGRDPLAAGLDD